MFVIQNLIWRLTYNLTSSKKVMIFGVLQTVQLVRKNWLIFDLHISIYSPTGSKKLMIFDGYPKNHLIFNILSHRLKIFNCYRLKIWLTLDDPHIVPIVQKILWLTFETFSSKNEIQSNRSKNISYLILFDVQYIVLLVQKINDIWLIPKVLFHKYNIQSH